MPIDSHTTLFPQMDVIHFDSPTTAFPQNEVRHFVSPTSVPNVTCRFNLLWTALLYRVAQVPPVLLYM